MENTDELHAIKPFLRVDLYSSPGTMKPEACQKLPSVVSLKKMHLHPLTLAFRHDQKHLEDKFLDHYFFASLPIVRFTCFFALIVYAAFGILDAYLIPEKKNVFWFIRYAIFCPYSLGLFLFSFTSHFRKMMQPVLAFWAILGGAGIIYMILVATPPVTFSYYAGLILVFMMGYTVIKLRFVWATFAGWLLVLLYEVIAVFFVEIPVPILLNNNFFFIGANLIGMFACYAFEYYARRDFFLQDLLEKEQEKVRDGRNSLEERVRERTSELRQSLTQERNLTQIIEKSLNEIYLFDADTYKFLFVNEGARANTGYSQGEFLEMTHFDINPEIDESLLEEIVSPLRNQRKENLVLETIHKRKDGSTYPVEIYLQKAKYYSTSVFAAIVLDITQRKNLEEELFQAHKMEAIGTLAGGIAHDFNNILSAIIGFCGLAKENIPPDNPASDDIDEVIMLSRRAAGLVKQILSFSRKSEHDLQSLNPSLIVKEVLRMLRSSLPSTIIIREDLDEDCGQIRADPTNIHQIMMNLCTNAYHAMEEEKGTLTVRLYRRQISDAEIMDWDSGFAGSFVVLSVSDTGHGMDEATKERIFQPFFTTKETGKGTGMGLAVIYGIIQDYNGFVRVDSTPGEGSTFSIYIPALQEESISPEDSALNGSENETVLLTGKERILVVDDELQLVKIYKRQLERCGYAVTITTDSAAALEMIRAQPDQFDLLITDQTMPGLTGAELAQEVNKINSTLPVILCTGHSDVVSKEDALAMGIKKYVTKPINRDELFQAIRDILDEK